MQTSLSVRYHESPKVCSRDNPHKNIAGSSFVLLKMTSGPRAGLADHLFLPHETQPPFKFTSLILLLLGLKMFIWTTSPCGDYMSLSTERNWKNQKYLVLGYLVPFGDFAHSLTSCLK